MAYFKRRLKYLGVNSNVDYMRTKMFFDKLSDYDKVIIDFKNFDSVKTSVLGIAHSTTAWFLFDPSTNTFSRDATYYATATYKRGKVTDPYERQTVEIEYTLKSGAENLIHGIGGYSPQSYRGKIQWYDIQCYKNNVLIRHFIPAMDSDDKICMWDLVSNTGFYNEGTLDFQYEQYQFNTSINSNLPYKFNKFGM